MNKENYSGSFINLIGEIIGDSTVHGLPRLIKSKSILVKIVWAIFTFISFYFCIDAIRNAVLDYLTYPTITSFGIYNQIPSPFPAITICNINPFQTDFALDYLNAEPTKSFNDTYNILVNLLNRLSLLDEKTKRKFAFSIDDILISCRYFGQICDSRDFDWYFDNVNGNCFRFNSRKDQIKNTKMPGFAFGLNLELFVGNEDKMPSFVSELGYQLMIDNQTYMPTIGEGIFASAGTETFFEISRSFQEELEQPYSECLSESQMDASNYEFYKAIKQSNQSYRQSDCFILAIQKFIIENCGCYSPITLSLNSKIPCSDTNQSVCFVEKYELYLSDNISINYLEKCPRECNTQSYNTVVSTLAFPSKLYALQLINNSKIVSQFPNESLSVEKLTRSVLSMKIYYKDLSYSLTTELQKNKLIDLISNIGGILGLYIGNV